MKNIFYASLLLITLISGISLAQVTITSAASGNWNDAATWVGGVAPSGIDAVIIASTHTVTVDNAGALGEAVTVNAGGTLNIVGAGGAKFASSLAVNGTLTVNTSDSLIVGYLSTGDKKIDLTNSNTGVGTFTRGTVLVYGKFNTSGLTTTTINGANIIIDAKGSTGYAFRSTTGSGGTHPFTFTSGTITILNPAVNSANAELAMSASIAPDISGTATFVLGQGAGTVASAAGYRISLNSINYLNNIKINTGSVNLNLLSNVNVKGKLELTGNGTLAAGTFYLKYGNGGTLEYNASSPQTTSDFEFPAADTLKPTNLTINNSSGVTLHASRSITGNYTPASGSLILNGNTFTYGNLVSVKQSFEQPVSTELFQNYPNPFNPSTSISFSIPKSSFVTIIVYDISGNEVATLMNDYKSAGTHNVSFDASKLSSGVYLYRLIADNSVLSKKLTLIK